MPGIYGSKLPSTWIKEAVEKKACVDILLIGDSNIGYKEVGDTYGGWMSGLSYALSNVGSANNMFATAIVPANSSADDGPNYGYKYTNSSTLAPSTGGDANSASTQYGGVLSGWGQWNLNSERAGVWYLPQDTVPTVARYQSFVDGWSLDSDCPIGYNEELRHRIVVANFNTAGCEMNVSLAYGQTPFTELSATNKTLTLSAASNPVRFVTHITTAAAATRNTSLAPLQWRRAHPSYGVGIQGPIALLWSSVSRPGNGWSVSPMIHHGGATLRTAVENITNGPAEELDSYLSEVCSRQIASSGKSPRIVFALYAGINQGDTALADNNFNTYVRSLNAAVEASMIRLGYGKQNIAYLLIPPYPVTSDDLSGNAEAGLLNVRATARTFASQERTDINVAFVDLREIAPYSFIDGNNYYRNPGASDREHLKETGYFQIASRAVFSLLEYVMPGKFSQNPTSTVESYGPALRGSGADSNSYVFSAVSSSTAVSLPKIETYPATFVVSSSGSSNQPCGFVHATSSSTLVVSGATGNLSTTPSANVLVPSISNGILTFTANATFTARDIFVTRVG